MSTAAEYFDAGVAALGILNNGPGDTVAARRFFTAASEADAEMCDAWLGRMYCGEAESGVVYRAWKSRHRMHQQLTRLGVSPAKMAPRVDVGMGIVPLEQPIHERGVLTVALARMVAMGSPPDYPEAIEILSGAPDSGLTAWVHAAIYYQAQRWPDVISTIMDQRDKLVQDRYLAIGVDAALGIAYASQGDFEAADHHLKQVESQNEFKQARPAAMWYLALIARERGDEDTALALMRQTHLAAPSAEVADAIANPGIRLQVASAEAIASRTDPWDPDSGTGVEELASARAAEQRAELLGQATAELEAQIGMAGLKEQIKTFRARIRMAERRRELGLKTSAVANHMVFVGPPGTGKTTVARIIAKVLCGLGVVATSNVVEVAARDLLGKYEGFTAEKTREALTQARGGVLFLDEAYALVQERSHGIDPFGKEALDTLLAYMENEREHLVVIIAGYEGEIDRLLSTNEGLRSRFAHRFRFETYAPSELVEIARVLASARDDIVDDDAAQALEGACGMLARTAVGEQAAIDVAGNGRFIRKLIEAAADLRDLRNDENPAEAIDEAALMTIRRADMEAALAKVLEQDGLPSVPVGAGG